MTKEMVEMKAAHVRCMKSYAQEEQKGLRQVVMEMRKAIE